MPVKPDDSESWNDFRRMQLSLVIGCSLINGLMIWKWPGYGSPALGRAIMVAFFVSLNAFGAALLRRSILGRNQGQAFFYLFGFLTIPRPLPTWPLPELLLLLGLMSIFLLSFALTTTLFEVWLDCRKLWKSKRPIHSLLDDAL